MLTDNIQRYLHKYSFQTIRLKAVLFDMDGVLYNSMIYHSKSWEETSRRYGFDLTAEESYLYEGQTGRQTINMLAERCWHRPATSEEQEKIYATKCDIFNHYPEAEPMAGAAQLLRQVKSDGFQIVLVTGSGQKTLLNRLDRNYFGIFHNDLEITSYDVHNGKPSPEPYLRGLQKAAVKPWEALVVENAPLGVQAGVTAQIFTIAVNTGPLSDKVLHDAGADLLLPSMTVLSEQWSVIRDSLA